MNKSVEQNIKGFGEYLDELVDSGEIDTVVIIVGKSVGTEETDTLKCDVMCKFSGTGSDLTRTLATAMGDSDFAEIMEDATDLHYVETRTKKGGKGRAKQI